MEVVEVVAVVGVVTVVVGMFLGVVTAFIVVVAAIIIAAVLHSCCGSATPAALPEDEPHGVCQIYLARHDLPLLSPIRYSHYGLKRLHSVTLLLLIDSEFVKSCFSR